MNPQSTPSVDLEEPVIRRAEGGAAEYPELPPPDIWVREDFGLGDTTIHTGYTSEQMRAYIDADRAARAALQGGDAASEAVTIGEGWLLDSKGQRLVGTSHHYTAANIKALIWELKALEDPRMTTQADFENRDWRAWSGILHRVLAGLASEVPLAPDDTTTGRRIVDSDVEGDD